MSNEEKLFYGIGEVAEILQLKAYVLRFWETEFKKLNPQKSFTGQRTYRV
ncbi:MAG TPA: MerR family transcriptional regulator, partial [bacterium]|nr:MerR family transcriptional regulator [bacterium]